MLSHLHIRNFAIIEELSLELDQGLTVVTGETGAGKSIMIDAIGLVLGDRAEQGSVRHGADKAEITLTIEMSENSALQRWLGNHDMEQEDQCILRRVITQDGRSRAYINGAPTTLAILRELAEQLVNIHGQHAHQLLLKPDTQRDLLDAHGDLIPQLRELGELWKEYKRCEKSLRTLRDQSSEKQSRIDLLTFHTKELEELALEKNEFAELEAEQLRLANADEISQTAQRCLTDLYESDEINAYHLISASLHALEGAANFEARFTPTLELLSSAQIQLQETTEVLRDVLSSTESDPQRLIWVESRVGTALSLARKHHVEPCEIPDLLQRMSQELDALQFGEENEDALLSKLGALQEKYLKLAGQISKKRQKAANDMSKRISEIMQALGMTGGQMLIELQALEQAEWKSWGTDQIEFKVAANPGQPAGSLAKVASGGELSRISLAIQLIAAEKTRLPTMIFDEVDSGIGGGVAEVVGQMLRSLGRSSQVFCVTHLPQVASQGHHHLQVQKSKSASSTQTRIVTLHDDARVTEIARMLGGVEITNATLEHASEMLARAAKD